MLQDIELLQDMQDQEFQKILQNDEILNELDKQKNDAALQYLELMSFITKRFKICGIKIIPFTPVIVSYLYAIDNRFFNGKNEKIRPVDIDVIFYILSNGFDVISENLFEEALQFCPKHNITYPEAHLQILNLIHLSFRPLEMWPQMAINNGQQAHYNLDWLTKILSIVAEMTNLDVNYIAYNMALTEVFSYVIQYLRKGDTKGNIRRRNSIQIDGEIYKRTIELGKEYSEKKRKIKNVEC